MNALKIVEYVKLECGHEIDLTEREAKMLKSMVRYVCPKCQHTSKKVVDRRKA